MSILNKKYIIDPLHDKNKDNRRSFVKKSLAALFGVTVLANAEELFAMKSKTGYVYVKQNGEVINNYQPMGDVVYLGEVGLYAFGFAPNGWALCNGQILSIAQNNALFSLLGTMYGGNGSTTFALPDLRGRAPIHSWTGVGTPNYAQGGKYGSENVTLLTSEIPEHTHQLSVNSGVGTTSDPANSFIAQFAEGVNAFSGSSNAVMNAAALSTAGGNQPHENMQPYLTLSYCIATQGLYPSQS